MIKKVPSIQKGQRICDKCRKTIAKLPEIYGNATSVSSNSECGINAIPDEKEELDVSFDTKPRHVVSCLNSTLESIEESPVSTKKLTQVKYPKQKFKKVKEAVKRKIFNLTDSSNSDCSYESEIIEQLKEKFHTTVKRSEKVKILTVLPKSWSIRKIQQEFKASNYMVRSAKKLVTEKGILSSPNLKLGKLLPPATAEIVKQYYLSDEISRVMPGRKDYVSVNLEGNKVHLQKRLILCNLKEAYLNFKEQNPGKLIGFSKFAELRPKNCILAGASGTHAVCVCTIHQNVKLMILGAKLYALTEEEETPIKTYEDCLSKIICNVPGISCYLGECEMCPGVEILIKDIEQKFEESNVDNVTYRQWMTTDRSTLEVTVKSCTDFLDSFAEKLNILLHHSFIARQQSCFYKELKLKLRIGEIAVICDFSENYSILQDEAQGFHWNNAQATIHPFVAYYSENEMTKHMSFVVISNCLVHDTVAVHLFQSKLCSFLSDKFKHIANIYYFSDGAASQYKNRKNFINLCYHKQDFGMDAEWHFFATSHGKGACDGVGGTVKRLARKASLQNPYEQQIMTPRQLYDWAVVNIRTVTFEYCTIEEHSKEIIMLEDRFRKARTLPGTRKIHSVIPVSKSKVQTKVFSEANTYNTEHITLQQYEEYEMGDIVGFVTCEYNGKWWLACVLQVNDIDVQVTVLHPSGPSKSFSYPSPPDILWISAAKVLTKVDPKTATGRTYFISENESHCATEKLETSLCRL